MLPSSQVMEDNWNFLLSLCLYFKHEKKAQTWGYANQAQIKLPNVNKKSCTMTNALF